MADVFDVIVIGGGSTGENVADRAVRGGLSAALVESDLVGGDCSYWACMPSKALLRGSEAVAAARAVSGAAEAVASGADAAKTLARRDSFAARWSDAGQVEWAQSVGITVIRGHGRITDHRRVQVRTSEHQRRELSATHAVVVCSGSEPALPPIPGLADARPWTTKEGTSARQRPDSMIVLGGGAAGCELATAWAGLGTPVTVIEAAPRLLPTMEPFAGELVADGLRRRGVDVRTGVTVGEVRRAGDGPTTVVTDAGDVTASVLLAATGRRPRVADLGLGAIGLPEDTWIDVDETCRVRGVDGGWLFAAGDVNGRHLFTHQGKYQARLCGDAIVALARGEAIDTAPWSAHTATADRYAAPAVVFTDPQVATVGRSADAARADGITVRTVEYDLASVSGAALYADDYAGRAAFVVDVDHGVLVGATFAGPETGELLHAATVAIVGAVPLDRLWHAVPAYPTISEVWLRFLETYGL